MKYDFTVPCLLGVEGLVADELRYNGFEGVAAENGRVSFIGDMRECARANIILRCGERVLLKLASFRADNFEDLFQGVKGIPWEDLTGKEGAFPVKGHSIGSKLHSVPACQSIVKKAVAERLKDKFSLSWLEENGPVYQISFSIMKDIVTVYLDTSGEPLYKRGYKRENNLATMRETLAASLVKIARYKGRETFIDPFCGSGTIAIEAAMAALDIKPGARRNFECEKWGFYNPSIFDELRNEYIAAEKKEALPIYSYDLDPECVKKGMANAERAGVAGLITFEQKDALKVEYPEKGTVIADPPYGQRMLDIEKARRIYEGLGRRLESRPGLKKYIITSDSEFERHFGIRADKKHKLYNGMIKCDVYMYFR